MKIFGMGGLEIVIILVVVLLIFGPKNLPKLGSAFGKTVSNLRAGMNEGKKKGAEVEAEAGDGPEAAENAAAELEGEVEEVVVDAADAVEEATSDIADAAEEAVAEASAAVDEAFDAASEAPKKVKRVVRKKAVADEPAEPVE